MQVYLDFWSVSKSQLQGPSDGLKRGQDRETNRESLRQVTHFQRHDWLFHLLLLFPIGGASPIFNDEENCYRIVKHDHIAYRFEILYSLGKGSFGQVVAALDHRSGDTVAIKIVRTEPRFTRQDLHCVHSFEFTSDKVFCRFLSETALRSGVAMFSSQPNVSTEAGRKHGHCVESASPSDRYRQKGLGPIMKRCLHRPTPRQLGLFEKDFADNICIPLHYIRCTHIHTILHISRQTWPNIFLSAKLQSSSPLVCILSVLCSSRPVKGMQTRAEVANLRHQDDHLEMATSKLGQTNLPRSLSSVKEFGCSSGIGPMTNQATLRKGRREKESHSRTTDKRDVLIYDCQLKRVSNTLNICLSAAVADWRSWEQRLNGYLHGAV
ncbi:unnamed protein product [Protopolystoma xenopodis]|uniref:Protein kinase domain-containing protein n=1 Tax=Protopolystoma xenopodis TaxID=117903 RepID=A0A3S5FC79_9PLAT|nr:unnamed protein product [Protopolystoma xenopodis]